MRVKKISLKVVDALTAVLSFIVSVICVYVSTASYLIGSTFIFTGIMMVVICIVYLLAFKIFKIYRIIWRYATLYDCLKFFNVALISSIVCCLIATFIDKLFLPFPNLAGVFITYTFMSSLALGVGRLVYGLQATKRFASTSHNKKRTLIVGAGWTSNAIIPELKDERSVFFPICAVDDNPEKIGCHIQNLKIVGTTNEIKRICDEYRIDTIIIAIPSIDDENKVRILNTCVETKCELKVLPFISDMVVGADLVKKIEDVKIEDLLGREPQKFEDEYSYIINKRVLVTGGGGSIGSELLRQIAKYKPSELYVIDIYENTTYEIQQELLRTYKDLKLTVEIFSLTDKERLECFFKKHRPEVVFHAAAHKHVPLMEVTPEEAVKNNIGSTINISQLSAKYGVNKFVMISTDKAVNPTNVMGATKRVCEMVVQKYSKTTKDTDFVAVRFGNVLGSNGSVIPLFKRQIKEGGPVTVTHPEITRYFMTINEAVSLVLQAAFMSEGGELFVLDMGEPVKIVDLAKNLIKLSGLEPDIDINIEFTGLRKGEKLYEELLTEKEKVETTKYKKIFIGKKEDYNVDVFDKELNELMQYANSNDVDKVLEKLKVIVPTFDHKLNEK